MRPYFIVNPVAGGGRAMDRFDAARRLLDSKGIEYGYVLTERPKHSIALAQEAYDMGERLVIAVGGDGTVSEIASVLYDRGDVTMGILPFGTGNDISRALKIPTEPQRATELILSGNTRSIDMGLANNVPFVNVAGIGFDVDVLINMERYKKRFRGMAPYVLGILRTMFHLNRIPVVVTADGVRREAKMLLCAVGNGTHIGGGMAVTPKADPGDGLFDVCLVKSVSLLVLIVMLPSFIKGKHINKKPVEYFRARRVTVDCEARPLELDGEVGLSSPVTYSIVPSCLKVLAPNSE